MFRLLTTLVLFLTTLLASAQITTEPAIPVATKSVKIIFDSSKESKLGYFTGDLYAHTGVTIEGKGQWQNVIGDWGQNNIQPQLTNLGNGIYELEITPDINTFYSVDEGDKVTELCLVFRASTGSPQTNDLFVNVYEEGLAVQITEPATHSIFVVDDTVTFTANASIEASIKLFIDDILLTEKTGITLSTDYIFTEYGSYWLIAEATADSTVRDSVRISVRPEIVGEPMPETYKKGINYPDDTSAALVLWAPLKEYVYVTGDFNNWQISNDYLMKKDGDYFWLRIPNLEKGTEYGFQYLIDGKIKIADPYTEKILDPWHDSEISESTYPGLKTYPDGKTEGIVSVLQPGQEEYGWEVNDFQMPAKEKLVIYEMLIRDFTDDHTYASVIEKLDYLEDLRINVLELMPVNEFEGNSSWGYNPSFYFAPDKYYGPKNELKRLIDECHKRGIAVVVDMVLNHSYGQSPFVQMYWNSSNNRPSDDNPWYNEEHNFQNPDAQWGYDFNHESQYTKELVDSINNFWMSNYKIDGFRFDFTKGFSNTTWGSTSWGSSYDASRIANLKRMADEIWKRKSDALVIFEHLSDNPEEKELANYGIMLWGNMNYSYNEASMGYNENGKSDLSWGVYSTRGWYLPNLVTYMESHDEERLMFKNLQYGNSSGSYSIKQLPVALDRIKLNSVFYLPIPGPKMIWQFGERGYDISIDEGGRLGEKPPHWEYLEESDRTDVFQVMAKLNELKQSYEEFSPDNTEYSLASETKWYKLSKNNKHVIGMGNFGVQQNNINITFPETGKYYEFFTQDSIEITSPEQSFTFAAGEYRLYSTQKFDNPDVVTDIADISRGKDDLLIFPNPASSLVTFRASESILKIEIYNLSGRLLREEMPATAEATVSVKHLTAGIYLTKVYQKNSTVSQKLIVK